MVRRYADLVHVRQEVPEGAAEAGPPVSFLWRGRLYVVRTVLGHWRERRAWWAEAAARAVHGDVGAGGLGDGAPAASRRALSQERQVWRVEAGCGRASGLGIYDLCHDDSDRAWSLVQISD